MGMKQLRREAIKSFYKVNYDTTPRVARKKGLRKIQPTEVGEKVKIVNGKEVVIRYIRVKLPTNNPLRLFVKEYLINHK